ncbi:hypothetical protein B1T50_17220 [Mycobacterium kansasii]|nr:hypothetical protein B1T50_17220 [Mycobacterium kansasii]
MYWQPRSALSRIRLNSDYAEVCVKPRICGDVLRSWGVLADFLNADYAEVCVKPRICGDVLRSWGVLADFSA